MDTSVAVFKGLSDSLQVALSIQNEMAVTAVLVNAEAAFKGGAIDHDQFQELKADAQEEGYEFL